jgi:formyl-CoA transferase
MQLVQTADVVVENYRPDVKFRLGIDYESLKRVNPRIILVSISGFGQDGPYERRPGFDQLAQGLCGLMSVTGNASAGPMRVGAAVADVGAGFLAAMGVLTALLEREASGEGQWVQSNLLQAGLALLDFQAARYTIAGEVAQQMGNDHPTFMPTSAYQTSDGFINIAVSGLGMWEIFCECIQRQDLLIDEEFKTGAGRSKGRVRLNAEITRTLCTKTTQEWMDLLTQGGVPCGPIYTMDQVFADPQVKHLQASAPVQHPELGELNLLNQPVKLSRTPAHLKTASPLRGEHTQEILNELGLSEEQIGHMIKSGVV